MLQDVIRLELLAAQAILVGDEERGERRPWAKRVEEPHQPGPPIELGSGDRLVDIDVLRRHLEALRLRAGDRQLDLPG